MRFVMILVYFNIALCISLMTMIMSPGRGLYRREGVQGFARAALAGGIPCLLASKWNVPAKESIILMTRVYAFMALDKVLGVGQDEER